MNRFLLLLLLVFGASLLDARQPAAGPSTEDLSIQALLQAVEVAISTADRAGWAALLSQNADRDAAVEFFDAMVPPGVTRAVVRERDRVPLLGTLPGEGFSLAVDVFTEIGARGRITTWRLDIRRPRDSHRAPAVARRRAGAAVLD